MIYRSPLTHAMVKVAKRAAEETYAPDILAHELGHARLHGDSPWLMPARSLAPAVGQISNMASGSGYGLAGHLVPLVDETFATASAMKTLKDWDIPEEDRRAARKRLGAGLASYAVGPAVDAGLTVGGIATGNRLMHVAGPVAGRITEAVAGPRLAKTMSDTPIKGLTKNKARTLAKRTRPETDVYFAKKPLPEHGGFVSRPITRLTDKDLKRDGLRKELGGFIGNRASGKLLRKGGVVVGPTK